MKLLDLYPIIYDDCKIRILDSETETAGEFERSFHIPLDWLEYEVLTILPTDLPKDNGLMIVLDMHTEEGAVS